MLNKKLCRHTISMEISRVLVGNIGYSKGLAQQLSISYLDKRCCIFVNPVKKCVTLTNKDVAMVLQEDTNA